MRWSISYMTQSTHKLRVSCQKGPTRHAYAWQIGPFWQDTLEMKLQKTILAQRLCVSLALFTFCWWRNSLSEEVEWRLFHGFHHIHGSHNDVIKWKHFPRYWPFVRGIHRSPVNSPHKGQWRGALMFSLICVWINDWVSNREAGDLRRYRAHYDVTVMI